MKNVIVNPFAKKVSQKLFLDYPERGTMSQISFKNEYFWNGISYAFGLKKNEELIGVVIGEDTIKVRFRLKK